MRNVAATIPLVLALVASHDARADVISEGYKSVKLSMRVEADVPAGQTLLLGHTFRAIDVIKPGATERIEWHPLGGKLQIVSVPSSAVMANVEELRADLKRKELMAVFQQGKPCHEAFSGYRTILRTSPADVIHWNFKVTFAAGGCTATITSMEFFDKEGKAVTGAGIPDLPLGVPGVPADSPRSPPEEEDPWESKPEPEPFLKRACGCEVGPGASESKMAYAVEKWGPWVSLAMAGLVLGFRRRASRRK